MGGESACWEAFPEDLLPQLAVALLQSTTGESMADQAAARTSVSLVCRAFRAGVAAVAWRATVQRGTSTTTAQLAALQRRHVGSLRLEGQPYLSAQQAHVLQRCITQAASAGCLTALHGVTLREAPPAFLISKPGLAERLEELSISEPRDDGNWGYWSAMVEMEEEAARARHRNSQLKALAGLRNLDTLALHSISSWQLRALIPLPPALRHLSLSYWPGLAVTVELPSSAALESLVLGCAHALDADALQLAMCAKDIAITCSQLCLHAPCASSEQLPSALVQAWQTASGCCVADCCRSWVVRLLLLHICSQNAVRWPTADASHGFHRLAVPGSVVLIVPPAAARGAGLPSESQRAEPLQHAQLCRYLKMQFSAHVSGRQCHVAADLCPPCPALLTDPPLKARAGSLVLPCSGRALTRWVPEGWSSLHNAQ